MYSGVAAVGVQRGVPVWTAHVSARAAETCRLSSTEPGAPARSPGRQPAVRRRLRPRPRPNLLAGGDAGSCGGSRPRSRAGRCGQTPQAGPRASSLRAWPRTSASDAGSAGGPVTGPGASTCRSHTGDATPARCRGARVAPWWLPRATPPCSSGRAPCPGSRSLAGLPPLVPKRPAVPSGVGRGEVVRAVVVSCARG